MSLFCPTCANILLVKRDDSQRFKWYCNTCPYQFPIKQQMTTRVKLTRKKVDDIMGGEDAWKNVDSTDGEYLSVCPCKAHTSCSALSEMRKSQGFLHASADPIGR